MAQVLIRDLDQKVLNALKKRATRNQRSLQGELRAILGGEAQAGRRAESTGIPRPEAATGKAVDSARLIRESRNGTRNDLIPGNSRRRALTPRRKSVWDWLARPSKGGLSKEKIDEYVRTERESWGEP